jgi:hypothetical protein
MFKALAISDLIYQALVQNIGILNMALEDSFIYQKILS